MSVTTLIWIAAIVLLAVVFALIVGRIFVRKMRFTPNPDKIRQQERLNQLLKEAGFYYDRRTDVFSSLQDCWQREMGYCRLFDEGASSFNMVMDCEPIRFSHADKNWLIELWKGQYGITTGGEIGIYNAPLEENEKDPNKIHYTSVPDDQLLPMRFTLRKNGRILFKRKGVHWWLTGFRLGEFSSPRMLTMDAAICFPHRAMRDAFLQGLRNMGYQKGEYALRKNTVIIHFTTPHSPQPVSRGSLQEAAVQKVNQANCELYAKVTGDYTDTMDKLEYLENLAPELFEFCMHSLYAKGFYELYQGLKHRPGKDPEKPIPPIKPCPPEPCPPRPCPPKPCPPRPCPPKPCPPRPCPVKPCPPKPCSTESCPPRPCPIEPCPPRPCSPKACPPKPYPTESCPSETCPMETGRCTPYSPAYGGCRPSCPPSPGNFCRPQDPAWDNECITYDPENNCCCPSGEPGHGNCCQINPNHVYGRRR